MDNMEKFDDQIRQKLADHSEVPPDNVWDKVYADREKRKRRPIILPLLLAAAMITSTGGYFFWKQNHESATSDSGQQISKDTNTDRESTQPVAASIPESTEQTSSENNTLFHSKPQQKSNAAHENVIGENGVAGGVTVLPSPNANGTSTLATPLIDSPSEHPASLLEFILMEMMSISEIEQDAEEQPAVSRNNSLLKFKDYFPKPQFSVELIASPSVSIKQLESQPGFAPGNYSNRREESEKFNYGYNAQVYLHCDISENFFIRTGLDFTRIYELLSVKIRERYIASITIDTLLRGFIIDPFLPPQPYFLFDTIYDYRYRDYQFEANNRYTYLNIPFTAGYRHSFQNFDIYATAGLALNIYSEANGRILAADSIYLLQFERPEENPFVSKTGLSFMSSAGLSYRISPRLSFLFEPSVRMNLGSITKKEYPLQQRYSTIAFGMGFKYEW